MSADWIGDLEERLEEIPPGQWFSIQFPLDSTGHSGDEHEDPRGSTWPLANVALAMAAVATAHGFETRHSDGALLICHPTSGMGLPSIPADADPNVPTIDVETVQCLVDPMSEEQLARILESL